MKKNHLIDNYLPKNAILSIISRIFGKKSEKWKLAQLSKY
ncbi:hypothetical protein SAMN05444412_107138 [Rhodonellum ikkaensis]|uniref:Uncharacterized protein n=1 Tax=Rhodonellum ikkaensis TaxID=336829 RepID=A0A1H3R3S6_9BACT|nr:hypothetical protein SAMN05444412_107138 [Rhodonellum ikkaensis]